MCKSFLTIVFLFTISVSCLLGKELLPQKYLIDAPSVKNLHGKSALTILDNYFFKHPELVEKMLNASIADDDTWGYYDQCYGTRVVMRHLIASQIKAMAELKKIKSINDIFDGRYGVGSKFHKDKGTIGNIFSIWGHPVRKYILQGGRSSTRKVYDAFRLTLKNELKGYVRKQSVEWHMMPADKRLDETLKYLNAEFPEKTNLLRTKLKSLGLDLKTLIRRTIETNLLS